MLLSVRDRTRPAARSLAALVGVTCASGGPAVVWAADVPAGTAPCALAPLSVEVEVGLDPTWLGAVASMCVALGAIRDLDPTARLRLSASGELQSIGPSREQVDQDRSELPSATSLDVRAQPWVQLHLGEGGGLRPTASFAFEVSPLRVGRSLVAAPGLPEPPSWGASLGLGASWEGP